MHVYEIHAHGASHMRVSWSRFNLGFRLHPTSPTPIPATGIRCQIYLPEWSRTIIFWEINQLHDLVVSLARRNLCLCAYRYTTGSEKSPTCSSNCINTN